MLLILVKKKPLLSSPRWMNGIHRLASAKGIGALSGAETGGSVDEYERKTPHEHVLLRPGMYIGQIDPVVTDTWIYNKSTSSMKKTSLNYSPALLKIFDEILVNAADNSQRGEKMSRIDINITKNAWKGLTIEVKNDGKVIPTAKHSREDIYIPELIFGNLLTGSNFDDTKVALTGGRHGYGAKLTNIFSHRFDIEIFHKKERQLYKQTWKNNMFDCKAPKRRTVDVKTASAEGGNYTKVIFEPDLQKFGLSMKSTGAGGDHDQDKVTAEILEGTLSMMERRAFDVAACVGTSKQPVEIRLNGQIVPVSNFDNYVRLYTAHPTDSTITGTNADSSEALALAARAAQAKVFTCRVGERWDVAVMASPSGVYDHVSFVNSVWTPRGGTHLNSVTSQVVAAVEDAVAKASPQGRPPTHHVIRNHLMVFVRASVENPKFDSQAKDALTSHLSTFGSLCVLPASFLKNVVQNSSIVEDVIFDMESREQTKLIRATSIKGSGSSRNVDVPKLEDAHMAGTEYSGECSLILTEGDSAKALAVAGLEVVGRDKYGVLPLRGKILNVRGASPRVMQNNVELTNLIKALGLQFGKEYKHSYGKSIEGKGTGKGKCKEDIFDSSDPLLGVHGQGMRYGRVLIMTDQDHDGAHIKGLVINFFHHFWPSLLDIPGFLQQFITPLVKVKVKGTKGMGTGKGKDGTLSFYSMPEHEAWLASQSALTKADTNTDTDVTISNVISRKKGVETTRSGATIDHNKYVVKYYKGLGTNTAAEGRAYFTALEMHRKLFFNENGMPAVNNPVTISVTAGTGTGADAGTETETSAEIAVISEPADDIRRETGTIVDLAFNKKRAKERKHWLGTHYRSQAFVDPHKPSLSVGEFIDTDLMQFSFADNIRSLPSVVDGLKPAQRKVLFGCFKKKLTGGEEMKVVQLAGYIAEQTAYHHGDASLHSTIINMAQDYVGANNLPLLQAGGQFGTRSKGGKDFASPRYIFTSLSPVARLLYPEADDAQLVHQWEDGQKVEPAFFVPVVPTLLINGSYGIGTGWSTYVPPHDPLLVVEHTARLVRGESISHTSLSFSASAKKSKASKARNENVSDDRDNTVMPSRLVPWVKGFTGDIYRVSDSRGITYRTRGGVVRTSKSTMEINELPCGVWTEDYKTFLMRLVDKGEIRRFTENHTHTGVHFTITGNAGQLDSLEGKSEMSLIKKLRLSKPMSLRNMHAFNEKGQITHYTTPEAVCDAHFGVRLAAYAARKVALEAKYVLDVETSANKARFVRALLNGELSMIRGIGGGEGGKKGVASIAELTSDLQSMGYASSEQLHQQQRNIENSSALLLAAPPTAAATASYNYLLDMPIASLTEERVIFLNREAEEAQNRLQSVKQISAEDMWMQDLDALSSAVYQQRRQGGGKETKKTTAKQSRK